MDVIRVLIVDDHALIRAGLRSVLDDQPDILIVGEASTGEEAVRLAERCKPDVVIMDLDMPGEGGLAATQALSKLEPPPSVLILTVYSEEAQLVGALRGGARGYLAKDAAETEIVDAIRTIAVRETYVRPRASRLLASALRSTGPQTRSEEQLKYETLSARERDVLRMVAEGHSGPEIGRMLGVTPKTVNTYRSRVREKLGIGERSDFIRVALKLGLLNS